jgi:hypothetical protein
MMQAVRPMLVTAVAASLLLPAMAIAKPAAGKRETRIVVRPSYPPGSRGAHGFLPGYRQPPYIAEWRDRSPRHGGGDRSSEWRYWDGAELRYVWGGPGFYRGHWSGGGFGPCWTSTPIGMIWNCGR